MLPVPTRPGRSRPGNSVILRCHVSFSCTLNSLRESHKARHSAQRIPPPSRNDIINSVMSGEQPVQRRRFSRTASNCSPSFFTSIYCLPAAGALTLTFWDLINSAYITTIHLLTGYAGLVHIARTQLNNSRPSYTKSPKPSK